MESQDTTGNQSSDSPAWLWVAPLLLVLSIPMVLGRLGLEPISGKEFPGPPPMLCDWNLLVILAVQVVVAGSVLLYGVGDYLRSLPFRVSWQTIPLGLLGLVVWIGICELEIESTLLSTVGADFLLGKRPSVNPLSSFPVTWALILFLTLRFAILALIIPVAEELFLRGFLLRYFKQYDWWNVSMAQLGWWSVGAAALYGALTHTGEILAAIVWFGAVTVWVKWRDRFWDAVAIHAVTNLSLGIYVMVFQQWKYW